MYARAPPREHKGVLRNERKKSKNHRIPRLNNYLTNTAIPWTLIYSQHSSNNNQNRSVCSMYKQI